MNTSRWNNPQSGERFLVMAGKSVYLTYCVANQSSRDRIFQIRISGLPEVWLNSQALTERLAPMSEFEFTVVITPRKHAEAQQCQFNLNLFVDEEVDDDFTERNYLLSVSEAVHPKVVAADAEHDSSKGLTETSSTEGETDGTSKEATRDGNLKQDLSERPTNTESINSKPAAKQETVFVDSGPADEEERKEVGKDPYEDLSLDYDKVISVLEKSQVPAISMVPGTSAILRFQVTNNLKTTATYIIEEDRTLPDSWISLVADKLNLPPGTSGERWVSIKIPSGQRPTTYQFQIKVGPIGLLATEYDIILIVEPTLNTVVSAAKKEIRIGPMTNSATFKLTVANTGNADTAYRVQVVEPRVDGLPQPLAEDEDWKYLFDKEVDTFRAPSPNKKADPQARELKVIWKRNRWLFGFSKSQRLIVHANPVTVTDGKLTEENSLELTVKKVRYLPVPWYFAALFLILMLPIFGSNATDLVVTNGLLSDTSGIYYVLDSGPHINREAVITVKAKYKAASYARLRRKRDSIDVTGPNGEIVDQVKIGSSEFSSHELTYIVEPWLSLGNDERAKVIVVPLRSSGRLQVKTTDDKVLLSDSIGKINLDGHEVFYPQYTLHISNQNHFQTKIKFSNHGLGDIHIHLWTLHWPEGFDRSQGNTETDSFSIDTQNTQNDPVKFICQKSNIEKAKKDPKGWLLVTTDSKFPLIGIRFAFSDGKDLTVRP